MSAVVGAVTGASIAAAASWEVALLAGWTAASCTFVAWVWLALGRLDAAATARHATREDPSRAAADLLLLGSSLASLGGIVLALVGEGARASWSGPTHALALTTVASSWAVVHTVFALRYADLYHRHGEGIDWNGETRPDYLDFAYLAFTIGMTFQVSDTAVTARPMRRAILQHALLSYLFGVVFIAAMINAVAGLFRG